MSALKSWLEENNITQQRFAEMVGASGQTTVSYWCKHGVSSRKARRVSEATGIPVEELLPRDPASDAA